MVDLRTRVSFTIYFLAISLCFVHGTEWDPEYAEPPDGKFCFFSCVQWIFKSKILQVAPSADLISVAQLPDNLIGFTHYTLQNHEICQFYEDTRKSYKICYANIWGALYFVDKSELNPLLRASELVHTIPYIFYVTLVTSNGKRMRCLTTDFGILPGDYPLGRGITGAISGQGSSDLDYCVELQRLGAPQMYIDALRTLLLPPPAADAHKKIYRTASTKTKTEVVKKTTVTTQVNTIISNSTPPVDYGHAYTTRGSASVPLKPVEVPPVLVPSVPILVPINYQHPYATPVFAPPPREPVSCAKPVQVDLSVVKPVGTTVPLTAPVIEGHVPRSPTVTVQPSGHTPVPVYQGHPLKPSTCVAKPVPNIVIPYGKKQFLKPIPLYCKIEAHPGKAKVPYYGFIPSKTPPIAISEDHWPSLVVYPKGVVLPKPIPAYALPGSTSVRSGLEYSATSSPSVVIHPKVNSHPSQVPSLVTPEVNSKPVSAVQSHAAHEPIPPDHEIDLRANTANPHVTREPVPDMSPKSDLHPSTHTTVPLTVHGNDLPPALLLTNTANPKLERVPVPLPVVPFEKPRVILKDVIHKQVTYTVFRITITKTIYNYTITIYENFGLLPIGKGQVEGRPLSILVIRTQLRPRYLRPLIGSPVSNLSPWPYRISTTGLSISGHFPMAHGFVPKGHICGSVQGKIHGSARLGAAEMTKVVKKTVIKKEIIKTVNVTNTITGSVTITPSIPSKATGVHAGATHPSIAHADVTTPGAPIKANGEVTPSGHPSVATPRTHEKANGEVTPSGNPSVAHPSVAAPRIPEKANGEVTSAGHPSAVEVSGAVHGNIAGAKVPNDAVPPKRAEASGSVGLDHGKESDANKDDVGATPTNTPCRPIVPGYTLANMYKPYSKLVTPDGIPSHESIQDNNISFIAGFTFGEACVEF